MMILRVKMDPRLRGDDKKRVLGDKPTSEKWVTH